MKLVPRDVQMLYTAGMLGPVPAGEVGRLLFPTSSEAEEERRSTVRARLLKLAEAGLITVLPPANVASPNRYALTAKGRDLVVEESGADKRDLRVMTTLGRTNLAHHDMVVSLRVSLVLACGGHEAVTLDAFHPERELRRVRAEEKVGVVPDAIAVFAHRTSGARLAWAIEADTGTERHAVWRAKLRAYLALSSTAPLYGHDCWGVAVIAPTAKRLQTILKAAEAESCARFTVAAVGAEIDEDSILSPTWHLASGARSSLIGPLTVTRT